MIEQIDTLFCSKCKFSECSCYKGAKTQLFKEIWISRRKCCLNLQLICKTSNS